MRNSTTLNFKRVPLPPSSNNQYKSFVVGGRIRHACSTELVQFKRAMDFYFLTVMDQLKLGREKLAGFPLAFHVDFGFEYSRIISKKGSFKRMDVSNRLKAIHDAFADALLIDDSMFVEISARKHAVSRKELEGAEVLIQPCDFVHVDQSGIVIPSN